jgi:hypothetical protein
LQERKVLKSFHSLLHTYKISINNYLHLDHPNHLHHVPSHHITQKFNGHT